MREADGALLAQWIEQHGPRLWPVACAFAPDDDEAEDILQETWVVALRRFHTLRDGAPVGPWLHRIVLNVGRARRRKVARRAALLWRWGRPEPEAQSPTGAGSLTHEHIKRILWREIAELPALQRTVVLLRTVDGLSTAEAAHVIGRAEGTVKASLHRALKRLARRLQAQGVDSSFLEGAW
jgi:RNA polymerase sigma-70 factor (ECF subfamily)